MSIHAVRERAAGFSNVKSFAYITLELVDKVHSAVYISSYGVSEVGTGAGEWGRSYIGSIAKSETSTDCVYAPPL